MNNFPSHIRGKKSFGNWNLEFGIYLLFGNCNLVLKAMVIFY